MPSFNVSRALESGYAPEEVLRYLAGKGVDDQRYAGLKDEEKIRRLLADTGGKVMLPYSYQTQQMPAADVEKLYSQEQGITPELGLPMSLTDMVMEPVMSFLDEADVSQYLLPLGLLGMVKNAKGRTVPGELVGSGAKKKYIPAPASIEREADRLRSLSDLADPQAMKQAENRLRWQEWERPRLESAYGDLRPAAFGATKRRMLQNTPSAVDERIGNTLSFLAQPTDPWVPKDYGIFDRSRIKEALGGFPDVEQSVFPRSETSRVDMSYVDEVYGDPQNRELIRKQIERGLPLGGETFYASLWPVKQEWIARGGDPQKFDQWIDSVAPASARNSIMNENAVGNFLRELHHKGVPLTDENVKKAMAQFKSQYVGLPLLPVHREAIAGVLEGGKNLRDIVQGNLTESYKIPTYAAQKRGDFAHSWTGDVHEAGGETLGSRFNPYFWEQGGFGKLEYGPAETHMRSIAGEMGIPTGTAQAGRWFGGGELTGLKSPRGDALDMLEQQAAYTLHELGKPTDPVSVRNHIMELIEKGGVMLPWFSDSPMPERRLLQPGSVPSARPTSRKGRSTR